MTKYFALYFLIFFITHVLCFRSNRLFRRYSWILNSGSDDKLIISQAIVLIGFQQDFNYERFDDLLQLSIGHVPPVIITEKSLLNLKLKDLVCSDSSILQDLDHIIPQYPLTRSIPVCLIAGYDRSNVLQLIRSYKNDKFFPLCAFAVAVIPALNKTLDQLVNEITNDAIADSK
jgi:hypothetical protein